MKVVRSLDEISGAHFKSENAQAILVNIIVYNISNPYYAGSIICVAQSRLQF